MKKLLNKLLYSSETTRFSDAKLSEQLKVVRDDIDNEIKSKKIHLPRK